VIDLSGVTHLGATVIAALVEEAERSPSRHAPRLVVGRQGVVARVAALLDLGEHFEVVETLADAVPAPGPAR
jgi:anti-anti-sigma regulatory factor